MDSGFREDLRENNLDISHPILRAIFRTDLNRKILNIAVLCLGFSSIVPSKSDPNLGAILSKLLSLRCLANFSRLEIDKFGIALVEQ